MGAIDVCYLQHPIECVSGTFKLTCGRRGEWHGEMMEQMSVIKAKLSAAERVLEVWWHGGTRYTQFDEA